jgi:hypothetical protein
MRNPGGWTSARDKGLAGTVPLERSSLRCLRSEMWHAPFSGATAQASGVRGELAGPATQLAIVVPLGHLTHFMHIFQESHVPSQQT